MCWASCTALWWEALTEQERGERSCGHVITEWWARATNTTSGNPVDRDYQGDTQTTTLRITDWTLWRRRKRRRRRRRGERWFTVGSMKTVVSVGCCWVDNLLLLVTITHLLTM